MHLVGTCWFWLLGHYIDLILQDSQRRIQERFVDLIIDSLKGGLAVYCDSLVFCLIADGAQYIRHWNTQRLSGSNLVAPRGTMHRYCCLNGIYKLNCTVTLAFCE